jgi:hypothetical protein
VHYRLHTQRPRGEEHVPRHLTRRVRGYRAARSVAKLTTLAVLREPTDRARKFAMVARGTVDGVRGHLGRTVAPDQSDRPDGTSSGDKQP